MRMINVVVFILSFLILSVKAQEDCLPTRCDDFSGPDIRFPFRLKGFHPQHCGYPGFEVSCNSHDNNNITEFDFQIPIQFLTQNIVLPITAKATIESIDYNTQMIEVSNLIWPCLPDTAPTVNATASSSFFFENMYDFWVTNLTVFRCTSLLPAGRRRADNLPSLETCLDNRLLEIFFSTDVIISAWQRGCVKMYTIRSIYSLTGGGVTRGSTTVATIYLRWSKPDCRDCEQRGIQCRLNNNTNSNRETNDCTVNSNLISNKKVTKIVIAVGSLLVASAFASAYIVINRKQGNEKRIRLFLEDYKALRPSRYTYAEIKRITDNFRHKLGQGGYGAVFKGKLSNDILVAVKVLDNIKGNGEDFINEVATIGKIHHVNVVRLIGYCADGYKRALVYEFLQNDSLEKYISSGNQGTKLGWEKIHAIALGIAKGLDYLHQGCKQRILHFDIKPHNILLDSNLNPKVADFGLAKLFSKEKSVVTMTAARGTIGYIAPEIFSRNFGKVSYKSDIYSFGMLLLNLVGGRKNFAAAALGDSQVYFPEWMYNQLNKGEDIKVLIENENEIEKDENEVVRRIIIVGLWCIQWYPVDRPSTKVVIQMLESEDMPIMPPNPFEAS